MRSVRLSYCLFLVSSSLVAAPPAERPLTAQEIDFVETKVRPVLVEHCFNCHGPKKQMASLRLDSRSAMLKGGDTGPALVAGNPDASLLIRAVRRNEDLKMPPKMALKPEAVAALTTWVQMGAPWPEAKPITDADTWKKHWAFQPIADPPLPTVKNAAWARTPIDRFILAKLEEKGLSPAPPADRRTLLRRVTFDLIGLPPTPEEIAAFEADTSHEAFAKVVDRLLASPHYGERWGRHWLDVARYADTKGYVFFQDASFPWSYTYRDYVIRSLNDDLPYNQFLLEQLAADRLPLGEEKRALTALGFLTLGGRFMNNVHDTIDDRIDVVTRGLMGLTVTCARCHDHKYDPVPQADYYSLYGVFASSAEPEVPPLFAPPAPTPEYEKFRKELEEREQKLEDFRRTAFEKVVSESKTRVQEYLLAIHKAGDQPNQDEFMLLADGGDLNPTMMKRWRAFLQRARRQHHPVLTAWNELSALPEKEFAERAKELTLGWALKPDPARPLNALLVSSFATQPPATLADAAKRFSELLNGADRLWHEAVKRAEAAKQPVPTALPDPALEQLRQVFRDPAAPCVVERTLFNDLALFPDRPAQGKLQELRKAIEQWRASGPGAPPRAHALVDLPRPVEPHIFLRGNANQPGAAVPRQMPAVVAGADRQPFRDGSGRLELARAIVDPKNPLTARVIVNRVWLLHFGAGLVRTPSDFGLRSEPPSHPELLDHLATQFVKNGWSLKQLHRQMLLSATYQQSTAGTSSPLDPENRLLGRMNRQRLDFESLRDSLLAVAGRLDRTVGGPSLGDILSPGSTRRTLYGRIDRLQVPGLYRVFDFPSPDTTSPQRDATTIPQQALYLMNNPFVQECARGLVRRPDVATLSDPTARLERLHRLCFGRAPSADELALAREFLGDGAGPAWERYAQALLAANEFVFVD